MLQTQICQYPPLIDITFHKGGKANDNNDPYNHDDDHEGYDGNKLKPQRSNNPSPIKHNRPLSQCQPSFQERGGANVQMGFAKSVILNILVCGIF